ncbi:MAG: InlB B-repeat-containing protein, partial [Lachnospira sp.]
MGIEDALRKNKILVIICGLLLGLCVLVGVCIRAVGAETSNSNTDDDNGIAAYSVDETANTRKLMNGSFESEQTWSKSYNSVKQSAVPYWNTTATDEYIEMFMTNTSSYIPNVKLEPTDDSYAVELNANEESTLYQNVVTSPSSIYSWGLDHGARTSADTMALVIGPSQDNNPSKPSKTGRDQLMQMVDWLIDEGITEVGDSAGIKEQIVVYSKKFGENGTFLDNEGNDAFSLEPSSIYTEEWHIWIITDCKATSGTNPWGQYGANAAGTGEGGSSEMDLDEYYLYTVPSGQTKTMFGFVSVGCKDGKDKTYGNFLDNINFKLYYDLSGSITLHGSAVIVESSGGVEGEGGTGTETDHEITVGSKLTMYVEDGAPFKLQAIVKAEDARAGCEFVGMYFTKQDDEGNPETVFFGKELWTVSTNDNNDIVYTYNLENTSSAIDLQFVFIKSPTITYDPNDGEAYVVTREHNTSELDSVYSFKPEVGSEGTKTYIPACVSHEAVSEKEGWIFIGWLLTGDQTTIPDGTVQVNEDQLGTMLLDGVHTVACDYSVGSDGQYFKIWNGNVATTPIISSSSDSVEWKSDGTTDIVYANVHKGLTMVAQWRWKQAFIPQIYNGTGYVDSANGGNVEISSVTDSSDSYYDSSFNGKGGKAYYANTDEIIVATATVKDGFTFDGWYDSEGNLVSTKTTLSYTETKEGVNTYYARFSESVKQIYTRQIKDGTVWADTDDDSIATLSRYDYIDTVGKNISCTATVGSGYEFLGWYDEDGNPVDSSLLSADGKTIKYTTTGNAEYYARFQRTIVDGKVYQKYIRQIRNGTDWEISTDDNMATLEKYADDSSGIGTNVSVTATVVGDYRFEGWYDASGVKVSDDLTLSYAVVGDTTYYARFSGKITQTYIRRVKNGDDWYTADDSVGVLSRYSHTDFYGERVSVTATAKEGYKFEGWYDSTG